MPTKTNKTKPDDYHRHEAMDRAAMIADLIGDYLCGHPYIEATPGLSKKVGKAFDLIYRVYQDIGASHLK